MNEEGMGSSETPRLRTVAIFVWHHQRMGGGEAWAATMKTEAEQSQRVEWFRSELHRIVGEREDINFKVNGGCIEAEVEDLRFVALELTDSGTRESLALVTLLGRCPSCGVETVSEPLNSLVGLGKMMEKFEPLYEHFCLRRQ